MFDIGSPELLVVAIVALLIIGPKDLPKAMRVVGYWVGRARSVTRQFRAGFDEMVREAELAEMEKKWAQENERIMREHPSPSLPAPDHDTDEDARPQAQEGPDADKGPDLVTQPVIRDADAPTSENGNGGTDVERSPSSTPERDKPGSTE
ncbi:hypothetical protein GCM10023219_01420 [Stakelama sediminis]|uniref:Sec-independent protein translocase protein TatB n=1 Tax=Stakelama sediminis TaxID=463200 RepID=A0A840Z111_9SPHN|nr:Sec-independent protein translocase protein TatB [Stakelama sediminis]MBB5719420.1 sec-independent protein translocase protein TatB [Stakelama sediminis]